MPYVDSNLGDYVQNEIPLATLQEMVTAGTVPPNQVFLTPESEDVGMTNVYVNNELQKTLSFDRDPQTQITENKTNINKKLEPSNIKAGANINITTSGNDVTINAVAEAGGTIVNVNGVKQDIIDFTSDPQTQINSKFNSTNVVQSTGTSTTQVMSQKATTDALNGKMDWSAIKQSTGTGENVVMSQKATTDALANKLNTSNLLNKIYPVGSIYMSTVNKSPANWGLGGIWTQILGKFLLSSDDFLNGNGVITTKGSYHVGDTGGEETHTLTVDEMPSHTHSSQTTVGWQTGGGNSVGRVTGNNGDYNGWPTTIYNTGGGLSHNNMPPYYTVYMWRRIPDDTILV